MQPVLAHEPGHPVLATAQTLRPQRGGDPRAAVGLATGGKDGADRSPKRPILLPTLTLILALVRVVAAWRHVERLRQGG